MKRLWYLLAALTAFVSVPAAAAQWPEKPIHVLIGLSPGSAVDIVPRIVFEQVGAQMPGFSVVVENRTGASGVIASKAVAAAPGDGYTLLVHSSALVMSPFQIAAANYDPVKDFVAIAPLGNLPNVLVVSPAKNIHTLKEFVAYANKGQLTYGSVGAASYLAMEKFRLVAGFKGVFVPFRGAPEVVTEVLTGRVDTYYAPLNVALEFIRSGKLVALSVSGAERSPAIPDIPTSIEAGYPDSNLNLWIGAFAPAGTPHDIVEKLNHEIGVALANPTVRGKLATQGIDPMTMGLDGFQAFVKSETASMAKLAKALDLKPM